MGARDQRKTQSGKRTTSKGYYKVTTKEKRRFFQLLVSGALFMVMWIGKGIFPESMTEIRHQVLDAIRSDTDYRAVFALLGSQVDQGTLNSESVGQLLVEVFSGQTADDVAVYPTVELEPTETDHSETTEQLEQAESEDEETVEPILFEPIPETEDEIEVVLAPQHYTDYVGQSLPENATMAWVPISVGETVTPVIATYSSHYGWRQHPLLGEEKFHAGIDIAGDHGEQIRAFADGVIEFIGEGPSYGIYLQIQHADGVTSFYAHCSSVSVVVGQSVTAGDVVAEVGDTGDVTGAHLHFELKQNGTYLNPYYYLEP